MSEYVICISAQVSGLNFKFVMILVFFHKFSAFRLLVSEKLIAIIIQILNFLRLRLISNE